MDGKISVCLQGRNNNFDLIRFLAASVVIFSHSFLVNGTIVKEPMMLLTAGQFDTAHLSVAVFFIISGFLITRSYMRAKSIRDYFEARVLRIYPALIVVVFCTVFIIGPLFTTYNWNEYFYNIRTIKYLLLNSSMVRVQYTLPGVFESGAGTVNPSLWTLPIELACYCFVAIAGLLSQNKIKFVLIVSVITVSLFYYVFTNGFISLFFYFFVGAMMYIMRNRIILNKFIAIIALGILFINIYCNTNPNIGFLLKAFNIITKGLSLSYVIMYLSFLKTGIFKNFAKYGDFSYGLYIWGFPLQQIIKIYFNGLNSYLLFVMSMVVTLVFSALSWHLIEKRALRFRKRYKLTVPTPFV